MRVFSSSGIQHVLVLYDVYTVNPGDDKNPKGKKKHFKEEIADTEEKGK
jgi:hypothetical protein